MHKSFKIISENFIKDIDSTVFILEHIKTKAQVLYAKNDDENKSFAIGFKTIPSDNTGVPHILEHAVLNGSKKYPVKEPFTYLLKSSMASFINASTYPDKTIYPVASTNEKDLMNLTKIYLDAVFQPLISKEVFMQEGWHHEIFDKNEPLKYKGVVFNEMKGAMSDVDALTYYIAKQQLYKGSSLGFNYGGDPAEIPNLTYEDFVSFHEQNYVPANSKSLLYGNLDPIPFLNLLDEYFSSFDSEKNVVHDNFKKLDKIELQKQVYEKYPVSDADNNKAIYLMLWNLGENMNEMDYYAFSVLEQLITSESSDLKNALLESEYGDSFLNFGFIYGFYSFFGFGLKGVGDIKNNSKIKQIIFDQLTKYSQNIDNDALEGAINKTEFYFRDYISYNNIGLDFFADILQFWFYNKDPLEFLNITNHFEQIRQKAFSQNLLQNFIKEKFLDNQNYLELNLTPDPLLIGKQIEQEEASLTEFKNSLNDDSLENLINKNIELKKIQETPDSLQNLETLPYLEIKDIEIKVRNYSVSNIDHAFDFTFVQTEDPGIIEGQLIFDFNFLDQSLLEYLSLYSLILLDIGTNKYSASKLTDLLNINFGSIYSQIFVSYDISQKKVVKKFLINFKVLEKNAQKAFDLLSYLITDINFDNKQKILDLVKEQKDSLESQIVESGHIFSSLNVSSFFSEANFVKKKTLGLDSYYFYKKLISDEGFFEQAVNKVKNIHNNLINKPVFSVNIGSTNDNLKKAQNYVNEFYKVLNDFSLDSAPAYILPKMQNNAFTIPSQVNYVALSFDFSKHQNLPKLEACIWPIKSIVRIEHLWNEVRVKGGAYGAIFDKQDPYLINLVSYRDPNIESTFNAYKTIGAYLHNAQYTTTELNNLKIGSLRSFEPFYNKDTRVFKNWIMHITGYHQDYMQKVKDEILGLSLDDIKNVGIIFEDMLNLPNAFSVLGNKEKIVQYGQYNQIENVF